MVLNTNGYIPKKNNLDPSASLSQSSESTASTSTSRDSESVDSDVNLQDSTSKIAIKELQSQRLLKSDSSTESLSNVSDLSFDDVAISLDEKIESILDHPAVQDSLKQEIANFRDQIRSQITECQHSTRNIVMMLTKKLSKFEFVLSQNFRILHPDLRSSLVDEYRMLETENRNLNFYEQRLESKLLQVQDMIALVYRKNNEVIRQESVKEKIKGLAFSFFRNILKTKVNMYLSSGSTVNESMMKLFSSQDRAINDLNSLKDCILKLYSKIDQSLLVFDKIESAVVENSYIESVLNEATTNELDRFKFSLIDQIETNFSNLSVEDLKESIIKSIDSVIKAKQSHSNYLYQPIRQFEKDFERDYIVTVFDPYTESTRSNALRDVDEAFDIIRDASLAFNNISEKVIVTLQALCTQGMMYELSLPTTDFSVTHFIDHDWPGLVSRVVVAQPQEINTFIKINTLNKNTVHVINRSDVILHDNSHETPSIDDVLVGVCEMSYDVSFSTDGTFSVSNPKLVFKENQE